MTRGQVLQQQRFPIEPRNLGMPQFDASENDAQLELLALPPGTPLWDVR